MLTEKKAKMYLKTKRMQSILDSITGQVKKLEHVVAETRDDSLSIQNIKSMLYGQLQSLTAKLDIFSSLESTDYKETKEKITAMIEDFCCMNNLSTVEDNGETEDLSLKLLEKFTVALKTLEDLEYLDVKQQLQDSLNYVKEMGEVNEIEDFQNIEELGITLLNLQSPLQTYGKNLISKLLKEKMALYTSQLCVAFSMLAKLVQEQHKLSLPIYNAKKYICERTCWCLKMIIEIIDCPIPSEEEENEKMKNHFVYKTDMALDMISSLSGENPEQQKNLVQDLWLAIEQVFSHAMAIAQVCQPENFKAITGVSQSVLSEFENLKQQITSEIPDPMLNSLFINTFTDALYRLERKVNISVLSLVMEVFSNPLGSLKKLVKMCGNSLCADKRKNIDLNIAIEEFDQITDKVMQIGLYAIACCSDINRIAKIKNHMASLESLESELVPGIVSFYLHPDNKEMRAGVKLLTSQWQDEMNKLHTAIDLIIDSAAYCQVILDDLQDKIINLSDCLDNRRGITLAQVQEIVQRACTLATQITTTVDDIGQTSINKSTIMMIRELKAAIFEADLASKTLLIKNVTEPQQLRVIKRCELLLNVVKRLQPALVIVINNSNILNNTSEKSRLRKTLVFHDNFPFLDHHDLSQGEKTMKYIKTPYTVHSYKAQVSIQPANSLPKSPRDLSCLIPYIKKGRAMRTEMSIMYKTPKKTDKNPTSSEMTANEKVESKTFNSKNFGTCIRQHLFSRDSFSLSQGGGGDLDLSNESLDLTNILEKISCLSNSSSMKNSQNNQSNDSKLLDICSNASLKNQQSYSAIDTPQRLTDIDRLDRKIEHLQKQAMH